MLNLAIECSGVTGSVALYWESVPIHERRLPDNIGSVRSLAATIDAIVSLNSSRRVHLISVTSGPGSFTSLRAGLATAKMLAFAWQIPVLPVDTLWAIAHRIGRERELWTEQHWPPSGADGVIIVPVLNAFRSQVFTAAWHCRGPGEPLQRMAPSQVVDAEAWMADPFLSLRLVQPEPCHDSARPLVITGPGLRTYRPSPSTLPDGLRRAATKPPRLQLVPEEIWSPAASDVALIGWNEYLSGNGVSAKQLLPNYVRASAAEENDRRP